MALSEMPMHPRHSRIRRLFLVFPQPRRNRWSKRDGKRVAFTPGGSSHIYRGPHHGAVDGGWDQVTAPSGLSIDRMFGGVASTIYHE